MIETIDEENFITLEEKKSFEKELKELIEVERPEVIEQLKRAREYGDLAENQEYETAKNRQSVIESRITEIESILKTVEVIVEENKGEKVVSGSVVEVDTNDGEKVFSIGVEANGAIQVSPHSPIGRALFHKKVGDSVIAETPKGENNLKIKNIRK